MGAACGSNQKPRDESKDAPYSPAPAATSAPSLVPKSPSGHSLKATTPSPSPGVTPSPGPAGDEVLEDAIKEQHTEVQESSRVKFPEPAQERKFMDPDKSTATYVDLVQCATIAAQKGELYKREAFTLSYGLRCCACGQEIDNNPVEIMGYSFHDNSDCLACTRCHATLAGAKKTKQSDITVSEGGQLFCDTCAVLEVPLFCMKCNQTVDSEVAVTGVCHNWHLACMRCESCSVALTNVKLAAGDKMYCLSCYHEKFAYACHQCGRFINGRGLQVGSNTYHAGCCQCSGCGRPVCHDEGVYLIEGKAPVHMDCSKSVHLNYCPTDDEGILSGLDDGPITKKSDRQVSHSSISTLTSTISRGFDNSHSHMPPGFEIKAAHMYKDMSYLRHDTAAAAQTKAAAAQPARKHPMSPGTPQRSFTLPLANGDGPKTKPGVIPKHSTMDGGMRGLLNGSANPPQGRAGAGTTPGKRNPGKLDSANTGMPLAPVYYRKEREARKKAAAREKMLRESRQANGFHETNGVTDAEESEAEYTSVPVTPHDLTIKTGYDGDVSRVSRLDTTIGTDSEMESPMHPSPGRFINGRHSDVSDTDGGRMTSDSDTDAVSPMGDIMPRGKKLRDAGGYVTEDDVEKMQSGLGKEILNEMKREYETKDDSEDENLPQDPIKASRAPDAKTELAVPLFVEVKYGSLFPSGINRTFDPWLLEQATGGGAMSSTQQRAFMREFHNFNRKQTQGSWRDSQDTSLADGCMSDIGETGRGGRWASATMSDIEGGPSHRSRSIGAGYKSEGYNSSPEMRRKMLRYNSLDMKQAWYNDRFLTFIQAYHRRGHPILDQQKEAAHVMRRSAGSLPRRDNHVVYPIEKLQSNRNKKLPAEINRSRLELHLSDQEFYDCFHMSQEQFHSLPLWKQNVMKQLNYLF